MKRVAIVGAGSAGLGAAFELVHEISAKKLNVEVVIIEAANRLGGRILEIPPKQFHPDHHFPISLGPEFVHGSSNNVLMEWATQLGLHIEELPQWPNYIWLGREGRLVSPKEEEFSNMVVKAVDMFEDLADHPEVNSATPSNAAKHENLLQYLTATGLDIRFLDIVDAVVGNDHGGDLSSMGMGESVRERRKWIYGEKYLLIKEGWTELVNRMVNVIKKKDVKVYLNHKCKEVVSRGNKIFITSENNATIEADKVIMCVPLPVLRDGEIKFADASNKSKSLIPEEKSKAMKTIGMGNVIKIILAFKTAFWPEDCWDICCGNSFVPEVWVSPPDTYDPAKRNGKVRVLVGFIAGDRTAHAYEAAVAQAKSEGNGVTPENVLVRRFLLQLDQMFGTQKSPHVASDAYTGTYFIKNWAQEPLVRGGYTYPSIGDTSMRDALADPIMNKSVYFAGEATNKGLNPCVHGAIEEGQRVVQEILKDLSPKINANL